MYRASQCSNYLLHSPTFRCICQVTALNNFSPFLILFSSWYMLRKSTKRFVQRLAAINLVHQ